MVDPKEGGTANGLSFSLHSIAVSMGFISASECKKMILTASFLEPWSTFRDGLPLNQTIAMKFDTHPRLADLVEDTVTETYNCMDSMASCKFDSIFNRKGWKLRDYLLCFVYHTARNMARLGEPWAEVFDRKNVKNQVGRARAMERIKGLVKLTLWLIHYYTGVDPSDIVVDIETALPASRPENSPIKKIRREHELNNMAIADLRKVVVDMLKGNQDEREWLKRAVLLKEGFETGKMESTRTDKAAGAVVGEKRKRDAEEVEFVASKVVKRG
jgi:uncharacterized protein with HEPN domain